MQRILYALVDRLPVGCIEVSTEMRFAHKGEHYQTAVLLAETIQSQGNTRDMRCSS